MSQTSHVNGGNTSKLPGTTEIVVPYGCNSAGMPLSEMLCDQDITAVDVADPAASILSRTSSISSMERSNSRASSTSSTHRTSPASPPTFDPFNSLSTSHISTKFSPHSPQAAAEADPRRTGFRYGKDLLQPGGSPVKRVYYGKSVTSPVDLSARATEIAIRKRKTRDHESVAEGSGSRKKMTRVSEDGDGGSETEHSDQLDQSEMNNADPATVAKVRAALERKREKNRDSARKSRLAKKETVDRLQHEIKALKERLRHCETERDFWKAKGDGMPETGSENPRADE